MNETLYKAKIIELLESIGVSYSESRICYTHSFDAMCNLGSYPRLTRGLASDVLKFSYTKNDSLQVEPFEKSLAILTIVYLFDEIKTFYPYSKIVGFVEGCKSSFDLKDLNSGVDFDFDNPVPAIMKPLNEFLSSKDFLNMNWEFSLLSPEA